MELVMTPESVFTLTQSILKADVTAEGGRTTYLQALIATTQVGLGVKPGKISKKNQAAYERDIMYAAWQQGRNIQRPGRKAKPLGADGIQAQVAALTTVHDKFYEAVLRACSDNLPTGSARAKELNRRSNFARTAFSAARRYIEVGNDLTAIVAAKVTKASLVVERAPRPITPGRLTRRVEKVITELIEDSKALAALDAAQAISGLEKALSQIVATISLLGGGNPTTDAKKAIEEHRPFKTRIGMFYPTVAAAS